MSSKISQDGLQLLACEHVIIKFVPIIIMYKLFVG